MSKIKTISKHNQISKQSLISLAIIGVGAGIVLAALWLVIANSARNKTVSSVDDIQRISAQEAKDAYDQGEAVFLDVRDQDSYESAHIAGAANIPLYELGNRFNELDPNTWIITYCT